MLGLHLCQVCTYYHSNTTLCLNWKERLTCLFVLVSSSDHYFFVPQPTQKYQYKKFQSLTEVELIHKLLLCNPIVLIQISSILIFFNPQWWNVCRIVNQNYRLWYKYILFHPDITLQGWLGIKHWVSIDLFILFCLLTTCKQCYPDMTFTVDWAFKNQWSVLLLQPVLSIDTFLLRSSSSGGLWPVRSLKIATCSDLDSRW